MILSTLAYGNLFRHVQVSFLNIALAFIPDAILTISYQRSKSS